MVEIETISGSSSSFLNNKPGFEMMSSAESRKMMSKTDQGPHWESVLKDLVKSARKLNHSETEINKMYQACREFAQQRLGNASEQVQQYLVEQAMHKIRMFSGSTSSFGSRGCILLTNSQSRKVKTLHHSQRTTP
jgi:hypothetical protein